MLFQRLRSRHDFLQLQQQGKKVKGRHLIICMGEPRCAMAAASLVDFSPLTPRLNPAPRLLENDGTGTGPRWLGLTVSKKVGRAVVRNRVKRRLRAGMGLLLHQAHQTDAQCLMRSAQAAPSPRMTAWVIVALPSAAKAKFQDLLGELQRGWQCAGYGNNWIVLWCIVCGGLSMFTS